MLEVAKTMPVSGFDPEGEPEIRQMSDGSLHVVFNFMPPSFAEDDESKFADFDKQLEKAIGATVRWDDREVFVIRKPLTDTVARIKQFLEAYSKTFE
jgi:hypothetical protein